MEDPKDDDEEDFEIEYLYDDEDFSWYTEDIKD